MDIVIVRCWSFYTPQVRVTEIIQLDVEDVNLMMGFVRVFGKGNKERIVPLGDTVIEYLTTYIETVRPHSLKQTTTQALFLTCTESLYQDKAFGKSLNNMV